MRLIIAGPRDVTDPLILGAALASVPRDWGIRPGLPSEVVSGGAPGVDTMGERFAAAFGIPVKRFRADWDRHGKAAGPIRNREMAEYADALLAIRKGDSPGTRDMIAQATKRGLKVHIYDVPFERKAP